MIIDIHSHLGDILHPQGGKLIRAKNIRKNLLFDIISLSEMGLHRGIPGIRDEWLYNKTLDLTARAIQARNATGTLENMRQSLDRAGIEKTACMPIPPYNTFEDLRQAQEKDSGVIPFTGVDYTREYDYESTLRDDVTRGARGMKLHPIIQKTALNSEKTCQIVEAFAVHKLPVLFHCGITSYYLGAAKEENQIIYYGEIQYARDLVAAFPGVSFIAGHAGLFNYREVMGLLGKFKNVWVDISFQSPEKIRQLLMVFGPERVLYGSDWPYGNRQTAIKSVKKACRGDRMLEELIFHENAAALLGLSAGEVEP
jgi:predicted TIM-barrel fold metal-dependent hydrolase